MPENKMSNTNMAPIKIYDTKKKKDVTVKNPHSKRAKQLYKQLIDAGKDPAVVIPEGLRYFPQSQTIRKVKSQKPKIELRTSFKDYLGEFTIRNFENLPEYKGFELVTQYLDTIKQYLDLHGGIKTQLYAKVLMRKYVDDELLTEDSRWVTSMQETITNPDGVKSALTSMSSWIQEAIPEQEAKNGSMWRFTKVLQFDLSIAKYVPKLSGSYIELPRAIALKKAIVNVKNKDQECFKWSVLAALTNVAKDAQRVSKYTKLGSEDYAALQVDFSMVSFPASLQDVIKFEKANKISINIFGCTITKTNKQDKASTYVIQKSNVGEQPRQIDLLLLTDADDTNVDQPPNNHFCWIKNFSKLCGNPTRFNHGGRSHFCHYCLQGYYSAAKLLDHQQNGCQDITTCKPCMPRKEDAFTRFKNFEKQIKAPFAIYADFECLTKKVLTADHGLDGPDDSYTNAYQNHEPSGFTIYVIGHKGHPCQFKPYKYRGKGAVSEFIKVLGQFESRIVKEVKTNKLMVMTADDKADFKAAHRCHLCRELLGAATDVNDNGVNDKVRDHCHLSGKYRGAAHSKCNLEEGKKNTKNYKIPVFFHNLKNYDGHLIIANVGEHVSRLDVILQNQEKYISFTYNNLRFLDSAAFLGASLDTLTQNLYADGAGRAKFKHSLYHCSNDPDRCPVDLLLQKGVYPYDYMDSWERFEETELPKIEEFYSKLNESSISEEEYEHAQEVWSKFNIKNLGEYHDLYMTTDVLLLADIFENFRVICLQDYELDPCHYFTLPNFAWDCMLKKTSVTLELLTDYDMHIMVEQGLRGGISMISHRYAKANNKYFGEYDSSETSSYISYLDANNLYGNSMIQELPKKDFKWSPKRNINELIELYGENGTLKNSGCFVKVDLEYPEELHDEHNDYPLAPERKLVRDSLLSPYGLSLKTKLNIGEDKVEKLVPNLLNKTDYVSDIRNIEYYIQKGMKVTKVSKVITFYQEAWLAPYINFNTGKRAKAENDFEKDFYKLMNNAVFGKTMENLRNRVDVQFVTDYAGWGHHAAKKDMTIQNKLASPLYDGHVIYNEHLAAIKMKKKSLTLNKPIYAGMSILDLSKLHMYQFHYDYIKPKYGDKAKLLMTDTDSLCYHVEAEDFYQDMKDDGHLYDMSNFTKDPTKHFYDDANKKVVGKFKDEWDGVPVKEFVGLRPKMYSMVSGGGGEGIDGNGGAKEKKTGKGIKRAHLKSCITHADYKRCITSNETKDQQQLCQFNCIRSKRHQLGSYTISKVGLCCYDNKRYILEDGVSSLAYGHHDIPL